MVAIPSEANFVQSAVHNIFEQELEALERYNEGRSSLLFLGASLMTEANGRQYVFIEVEGIKGDADVTALKAIALRNGLQLQISKQGCIEVWPMWPSWIINAGRKPSLDSMASK